MKPAVRSLRDAVLLNPQILVPKAEVRKARGVTERALADLGVSRKDLKRLERMGLAIRAYTQNMFPPKEDETAPDGKSAWAEVPILYTDEYQDSRGYTRKQQRIEMERRPRYWYRGKGHELRWVIFAEALNA